MPDGGLEIAFFGSSLVSAWWNGACTYYRGVIRGLHELGHRRGSLDRHGDLEEHALDVRLRAPELRPALQQDLLPRHPAHEPVRPRAHGARHEIPSEVPLRIDVLRQDHHIVEVHQLRRQRLAEGDDDGVIVDDVRRGEIERVESAGDLRRFGLRIDDLLQREEYVARQHRRSIGERGVRIEVKGVLLAVVTDLPLRGDPRRRLQVLVEFDQRREQQVVDEPIVRAVGHDRIERGDVLVETPHQRPSLLRLRVVDRRSDRGKRAFIGAGDGQEKEDQETLHPAIIGNGLRG